MAIEDLTNCFHKPTLWYARLTVLATAQLGESNENAKS